MINQVTTNEKQEVQNELPSFELETTTHFENENVVPTTAVQQELFSASQTDPDASRAYNQSISIFFDGKLDIDAIYSALVYLLRRHDALRGSFSPEGHLFRVREQKMFSLPILDWRQKDEYQQKIDYDQLVRAELNHLFDLVHGPLFRSKLIRTSERNWTLIFNCHHVVVDGWSLKVIMEDLPQIYTALINGGNHEELPPVSSFVDYVFEISKTEQQAASETTQFWRNEFADFVPVLELPLERPRPAHRTYDSKREDHKINRKTYDQLKAVGIQNGLSPFISLFSSFAIFLHRISGQNDLVIGVPAAGQIRNGKPGLLGHDAQLLPIRCQLSPDDTFKTFSNKVKSRFLAAYDHSRVSLPGLIRDLNIPIDPARVPFVSVMFNFDAGIGDKYLSFEGVQTSYFFNPRNFETFEISINAAVRNDNMILECAYNAHLFSGKGIRDRLCQIETLIESLIFAPDVPVNLLNIIPKNQLDEIEKQLNSNVCYYNPNVCVDDLIQDAVKAHSKIVAIECNDSSLTYETIWEQSGRIASHLLSQNLGDRPLIGVLLDPSIALIPTLLGVWRAGGAFIPLDPKFPSERLRYMVTHSGVGLILSKKDYINTIDFVQVRYLDIDNLMQSSQMIQSGRLKDRTSDDLAYVIYTSGSTGLPKGVMVSHRSLGNFLTSMKNQAPKCSAHDRILSHTTLSFDIAQLELWLALITGACVVIADRTTATNGIRLAETIDKKKITFIQASPATWRLLLESGWSGNKNITGLCGGEALTKDLADSIRNAVGTLWNVYGPTETTVWSTIDHVVDGPIMIGKPIGNTQVYIVDAHGQKVPPGVSGELWLGGDGVTKGYLGREDLTQERFIKNPFTGIGRIYKTGDLVRLRDDFRIEYLGRNDTQVKLRGFRIELEEIRNALSSLSEVDQCTIKVKEKSVGDAHLVAYYSLKVSGSIQSTQLKNALKKRLPEYMIPSHWIEMQTFPLTPNKKLDSNALPNPFSIPLSIKNATEELPQTTSEKYLANLWKELLGIENIGRNDRFLDIGGHSLLVLRGLLRIKKERKIDLTAKSLFFKPLVEIALELDHLNTSSVPKVVVPNKSKTKEQPHFFGQEPYRKFGVYTEGDRNAPFGVLICPPLGQEYMRTHGIIRKCATTLNEKGLPTFRFDYFGHGDSQGNSEDIRLQFLAESILDAARELRTRSGNTNLKILSFRASSLILEQVKSDLGSNAEIFLVDPVLSGRTYLDEQRSLQRRRWASYPYRKFLEKNDHSEEIMGALYSKQWIQELERLSFAADPQRKSCINAATGSGAQWNSTARIEQIWISTALVREVVNTFISVDK